MTTHALHTYWSDANLKLVAKTLSEFAYEQAFQFAHDERGYTLQLDNGSHYSFQGERNIWGQIMIEPHSLRRDTQSAQNTEVTAALLMRDLQPLLGMSDEIFAEHLEDLNATLLSDCHIMARKAKLTLSEWATMPCEKQQTYFDGHPKFVFNKGRRGWGSDDIMRYAPEAEQPLQLMWVAVHHSILRQATNAEVSWDDLVNQSVTAADRETMDATLRQLELTVSEYRYIPVHPWQWHKKISVLFIRELACKQLVYLGQLGDWFLPQLSLRTLSNLSRPNHYDIKLPLTIMNTSCYRGIPGRYILAGPTASDWIDSVFKTDPLLRSKQAEVLQEPAAAFVGQADYQALNDAPYRYHELLGVIWRESAASKLADGEQAILMAALMEKDNHGNALIGEYIRRSGLSIEQWLTRLFDTVVIPYYHLLCRYGVSLIAHGQNVTLILENSIPKRILLKDFQGDMRLVDADYPEQATLAQSVKDVTVRLPEELIIHDLQTGHFITTLRFISPLVAKLGVDEPHFYRLLAQCLQHYMDSMPDNQARFAKLNLLTPRILRLGLNLAKFRHYTDRSASRMLPSMDDYLDNPLVVAQTPTTSATSVS